MKEITESHLPEVDFRSDQDGVSTYDYITNRLAIFRSHESDGYALAELLSDWLHDQCIKLRTQESDPTTYQEEVPLLDENSPRVDTIALTRKLHQETSQELRKIRDFCDTVCSSLLTQLSGDQGDGTPPLTRRYDGQLHSRPGSPGSKSEYFYANTGSHTLPAARGPVTAPEPS